MKLDVKAATGAKHSDVVCAVGWTTDGELWSASDDHVINKYAPETSGVAEQAVALAEDVFPTCMDWYPTKKTSDFFALGCTDGKFRFVSRSGRVDKTVEAHRGAITDLDWSSDGSAMVTAGEDGLVQVWSRSGMLKFKLVQAGVPVYSTTWNPDSSSVLHTLGDKLVVKPLQPTEKTEQWKAHDGIILQVDWNAVNGRIVSAAEDRKYKVWNVFGQCLYSSSVHDHPILSARWAPDGNLFAVGSFNMIRLCDVAGWSHSVGKPKCGAVYSLSWTSDSTRIAAGTAHGELLLGNVLDRRVEWQDFVVTLDSPDTISVKELSTGSEQNLTDFRDPVIKMSMAYGHLVVATARQCLVYKTSNWHTPTQFELKEGTLRFIKQSPNHVMLCDTLGGIQIYSYEGRLVATPKIRNARFDLIHEEHVSLSSDVVAIRDQTDTNQVHVLDLTSGAPLGKRPITHTIEIAEIWLDQGGQGRNIALVDKNRDLFVTVLHRSKYRLAKLGTMVQSLVWHDQYAMLAAISNGKFVTWYYPTAAFVDPDILVRTRSEKEASDFGKSPVIRQFNSNSCVISRADGAVLPVSVSPYPAMLHKYVTARGWDDAIRLCRFVKDEQMWACLAVMAAGAKELNAAEIAYAAIEEVDKVQYIAHIKTIPTSEGREAEMALFCREPDEAEAILIRAGLIFRALEMNCLMFRWDKALDLAIKHKTHIDTVLAWRQRNNEKMKEAETNLKFLQYSQGVEIDWDMIKSKIEQERENERSRPGAVPYA